MGKVASVDNNGKVVLLNVDDETAKVINNEDTRFRKKAQYHKQCSCKFSDAWKCMRDCPACEYFCEGKMQHFDAVPKGSDTDLWNTLADDSSNFEDIVADMDLFNQILEDIKEIMPEAIEFGELILEGETISSAAKAMGVKRTTLNSKRNKLKEKIYKKYGNIFRQK